MGSPLARLLSNIFMGHHEKIWIEQFKGPEILFYRRYVDNTFCLFNLDQDAIVFSAISIVINIHMIISQPCSTLKTSAG